jgi:hypothetical protein
MEIRARPVTATRVPDDIQEVLNVSSCERMIDPGHLRLLIRGELCQCDRSDGGMRAGKDRRTGQSVDYRCPQMSDRNCSGGRGRLKALSQVCRACLKVLSAGLEGKASQVPVYDFNNA